MCIKPCPKKKKKDSVSSFFLVIIDLEYDISFLIFSCASRILVTIHRNLLGVTEALISLVETTI